MSEEVALTFDQRELFLSLPARPQIDDRIPSNKDKAWRRTYERPWPFPMSINGDAPQKPERLGASLAELEALGLIWCGQIRVDGPPYDVAPMESAIRKGFGMTIKGLRLHRELKRKAGK